MYKSVMRINYICPDCKKNEVLKPSNDGLLCSQDHSFRFVEGTEIPIFSFQDDNVNEYSIKHAAEIHDNSLDWLFKTHHISEDKFREDVLSKLHLQDGQSILITGTGAGNDLPYISKKIGKLGEIYAQDFSMQMLLSAHDRVVNKYGINRDNIYFSLSDAVNLPFKDDSFDAVYHFGGINIFSDIRKAITEMDRVVKDSGRVVFGDEGVAPWLKETEIGQMLITNNPLYTYEVPLHYLPATARDVQVNWTINNCYYIVSYNSSKDELLVNKDLAHKGTRGGSIRTRHFGKLEGINPELRENLYSDALKKGKSRVEYLEEIITKGLEK